jgi:protein TonB
MTTNEPTADVESGEATAPVGSIGAVSGEAERAVREAAVMARIQAAKTYPDAARRRGIEGAVVVVFAIAADGSLLRVEAEPGGAHPLLVRAAVAAISEAAPYPPGGGAETSYRVTLVYRLER